MSAITALGVRGASGIGYGRYRVELPIEQRTLPVPRLRRHLGRTDAL